MTVTGQAIYVLIMFIILLILRKKTKMQGRQSRFLNLILGMDPISMLRAKGEVTKPFDNGTNYEHLKYYGGTKEINRYQAVVNVSKVVEQQTK